jgi:hypothetical protein
MVDQVSDQQISSSHREQAPSQNPRGDRFGTEALLRCLPEIHRKLSPSDVLRFDEEKGSPAPDVLFDPETIGPLCVAIKSLQDERLASAKAGTVPERQALYDDVAALCLQNDTGYFDSFHKLEEGLFALSHVCHELHRLVPDNRTQSPNSTPQGMFTHHRSLISFLYLEISLLYSPPLNIPSAHHVLFGCQVAISY